MTEFPSPFEFADPGCRCGEGDSTACVIEARLQAAAAGPASTEARVLPFLEARLSQGLTFHVTDKAMLERIGRVLANAKMARELHA